MKNLTNCEALILLCRELKKFKFENFSKKPKISLSATATEFTNKGNPFYSFRFFVEEKINKNEKRIEKFVGLVFENKSVFIL